MKPAPVVKTAFVSDPQKTNSISALFNYNALYTKYPQFAIMYALAPDNAYRSGRN